MEEVVFRIISNTSISEKEVWKMPIHRIKKRLYQINELLKEKHKQMGCPFLGK